MGHHPRVAVATRIFTPEVAAAAFRLDALACSLRETGARVLVLTSRPPDTERAEDRRGVHVSRQRTLRGVDGYIRGYAQYLSFDVPLIGRLLTLRPRPDVIVAEPPPTTGAAVRVAAAVLGVPYIYYAADVWSDAAGSMDVPRMVVVALRQVERFALAGAARVITVNEGVAARIRELGAREVDVVPNGIDTRVFAPADSRDSGDCPDEPDMPDRFLIYAGTASEWQGASIFVDGFLQVADEIPDLHLVYMGLGSDISLIEARAQGNPRIHFIGQQPPERAARWQAAAEAALVSIIPDQGYDYAYPTKVLAALACGTPVIYAGVGPVAADLRGSHLGVVADYDVGSVTTAIHEALSRRWDRARLRAWVQEHRSLHATGRNAARVILGETALR